MSTDKNILKGRVFIGKMVSALEIFQKIVVRMLLAIHDDGKFFKVYPTILVKIPFFYHIFHVFLK